MLDGVRVFDSDNHYYEPRDAFTRFIEPKFKDKAVHVVRDKAGERVMIGRKLFTFLDDMETNFDTTLKPGSLRAFLNALKSGDTVDREDVRIPVQPAFVDRAARLKMMDEQGIDAAFLFPTLGVCVEHFMKDDPEQMYANLRAFNRWLDETWGFARDGRIYAPPIMSLLDPDEAVKDLDDALRRGTKMISMRPGPAHGRSPADKVFDPFWSRANEAGLTVAFHVGESGYNEMMGVHFGEPANPSSHSQSAFQWTSCYGDRPIMDTMSILLFHNFFGRFPRVKVFSVENGSLWVPYLMKQMDKMKGMGRGGPWPGGYVSGKASEIFKRHVWVNPYHEEDHVYLSELIGTDHVVFGSDYPHPEGLEKPAEFVRELGKKMDAASVRKIMAGNAMALVGAS